MTVKTQFGTILILFQSEKDLHIQQHNGPQELIVGQEKWHAMVVIQKMEIHHVQYNYLYFAFYIIKN